MFQDPWVQGREAFLFEFIFSLKLPKERKIKSAYPHCPRAPAEPDIITTRTTVQATISARLHMTVQERRQWVEFFA